MTTIGSADVERFREIVGALVGLHFEDSKLSQLAEILARRLDETSLSCEAYLGRLQGGGSACDELHVLAQELTVGETYFFRNPDQFRAFSELALPDRSLTSAGPCRVRILSAGCASGEEPYSIAIVLADRVGQWNATIRAVDLNPSALAKAGQGRYSPWALRETPDEVRRRWFHPHGRDLVLNEEPRRFVSFEERNLADPDPDLWRRAAYDVVFCRNVLMYFTPQGARALVERIEGSLVPGGYLFLGHAETLRGLSHGFHLRHTHGTFYYERRQATIGAAEVAPVRIESAPDAEPLLGAVESAGTWVEAIQRASERIRALAHASERGTSISPPAGVQVRVQGRWELGSALELLRAERFGEALDLVQCLPTEAGTDPEVLLLRATLLTHHGQLAEAERACERLLAVDELNAGAQYLLALCREGQGDPGGAQHHDQLAAHLDPSFAMPRLHLGLLARRAGDRTAAGRELAEALDLLRREDASRLLMFGGGFKREALAALCQAEIDACGMAV